MPPAGGDKMLGDVQCGESAIKADIIFIRETEGGCAFRIGLLALPARIAVME
jgi:hypothetical protein